MRLAAILMVIYAAAIAASGALYATSSGDASRAPRVVLRTAAAVAVSMGLWRGMRWAWWLGVFAAAVLGVLSTFGAWSLWHAGILARAPQPALVTAVWLAGLAAIWAAFVCLLLPASRHRMLHSDVAAT